MMAINRLDAVTFESRAEPGALSRNERAVSGFQSIDAMTRL